MKQIFKIIKFLYFFGYNNCFIRMNAEIELSDKFALTAENTYWNNCNQFARLTLNRDIYILSLYIFVNISWVQYIIQIKLFQQLYHLSFVILHYLVANSIVSVVVYNRFESIDLGRNDRVHEEIKKIYEKFIDLYEESFWASHGYISHVVNGLWFGLRGTVSTVDELIPHSNSKK